MAQELRLVNGVRILVEAPKEHEESTAKEREYIESIKWILDRKEAYGTVEEQLDMMYHGTWQGHIKSVKDSIPKREK